jgi:hypothetical protein
MTIDDLIDGVLAGTETREALTVAALSATITPLPGFSRDAARDAVKAICADCQGDDLRAGLTLWGVA